jgi:hypothetical protein
MLQRLKNGKEKQDKCYRNYLLKYSMKILNKLNIVMEIHFDEIYKYI